MTEEEFKVGDLVKFNPSVMGNLGSALTFQVEEVRLTQPPSMRVSVVEANDPSRIGEEVYVYKSWLCRAPIKSKFGRRMECAKYKNHEPY